MSRFQINNLFVLLFRTSEVIYNWLETMGKYMAISTKCSCVCALCEKKTKKVMNVLKNYSGKLKVLPRNQ